MSKFVSPAEGRVTSNWGWRHLDGRAPGFHRGIDIAPPTPGQRGCIVYIPKSGVVEYVRSESYNGDKRGNAVTGTWNTGALFIVRADDGTKQLLGHFDKIFVRQGQRVEAGTPAGLMGDTGNIGKNAVHVHYEEWIAPTQGGGNGAGNTIDPRTVFRKFGITPGSAPILDKASTDPFKEWSDMATEQEVYNAAFRASSEALRIFHNKNNTSLHLAMRAEAQAAMEPVIERLATIGSLSKEDVERVRVAILGDRHPKTPGTDLRGAIVTTMQDVKELVTEIRQQGIVTQSLAGAVAAMEDKNEHFDVDKFLTSTLEQQRKVAQEVADQFVGDLTADINLTIGRKQENES